MNEQTKTPLIIDTDPGHDDALAILLLEKSGRMDIRAITTVAGNSAVEKTTQNARYISSLIGSKTPIYSGSKKPLRRELITAVVHGPSGLDGATVARPSKMIENAVQKIISLVRKNPGRISVLAIGPLTNLAKAFLRDPRLASLIKQVVIMGGAISVPGNKNRVAEFNIFVDPEAAKTVFEAPVKKVLVPLDVCNNISLKLSDFDRLRGSNLYQPIKNMMRRYIQGILREEKTRGALMYDPLAAYYLINPSAYELEPMDIQIETKGFITRGMTVVERRKWGRARNNVLVVTRINPKAFVSDFFKILKRKS